MDCWDPGRHWVLFHPHAVPGQEGTGAGVPGGAALGAQHVPVLSDCRVPNGPQWCRQDPDQVLRGVGHPYPPGRDGRGEHGGRASGGTPQSGQTPTPHDPQATRGPEFKGIQSGCIQVTGIVYLLLMFLLLTFRQLRYCSFLVSYGRLNCLNIHTSSTIETLDQNFPHVFIE